jgi:TfoX/Sxy family transcriptional regulator of competence genes
MAYDEKLAERVREVMHPQRGFTEKKMFGGICFLLRGNMCCGVLKDELMVRVGPEMHDSALARPHARVMDFTGRPSKGMVYVAADGIRTSAQLRKWVEMGIGFTNTLPAKLKAR